MPQDKGSEEHSDEAETDETWNTDNTTIHDEMLRQVSDSNGETSSELGIT